MTAQLVTVILDRVDGAENPYVKGTVTWTPSQEFPDVPDQQLVGMAPVTATFAVGRQAQVKVIANDTAGPQQGNGTPGWTWNVTYSSDTPGQPAAASYYVLSTNGSTQRLSSLATVPAAQPGAQYVPLPSSAPADTTKVLGVSQVNPLITAWTAGGGGSGTVTSVSVATANGFAGTVANPSTTPAISVQTSVTGLLKGNGTAVSAAVANTDYAGVPSGSAFKGASVTYNGTGPAWGPANGVTVLVPAPAGATATDTPNVTAAITSLVTALASGPAVLQFQDGTYVIDSNSAVIRSVSNFAVRGNGATVIQQAPNRSALPNNTSGDLMVIADCTDFQVEGITLDANRDVTAPIVPLSATAASGQPSVTVAAGQGASFQAGQRLAVFGGLGTSDSGLRDFFADGTTGSSVAISSITPGGGAGGGDLITFSSNLTNSYTQIGGSAFSDPFGPYAWGGAYLTSYQNGYRNSVAGRTLTGEDQQNNLHLLNCQRFIVSRVTSRNCWESPVKCGSGSATQLTDGCSYGTISDCVSYHGYDQGVSLWLCSQVTVKGCVSVSTGWAGISMTASDDCTVTGNVIASSYYRIPHDTSSGCGIAIEGGLRNEVIANLVYSPYADGMRLTQSPITFGANSANAALSSYLPAQTAAGTSVQVASSAGLQVNGRYSLQDGTRTEAVTIASIPDGTHVTFTAATAYSHAAGIALGQRTGSENVISGNVIDTPQTGSGINVSGHVRDVITGNTITGTAGNAISMLFTQQSTGVYAAGDGSLVADNIVSAVATGSSGIAADSVSGIRLIGNTIGGLANKPGISLKGVTDSAVSGNRVSDVESAQGIFLQNGSLSATVCARVAVTGNVIRRCSNEGIIITFGDSLTIADNQVSSCGGHAGINPRGITNSVISGNVCNSNAAAGIQLEDNSTTGSTSNRVTGNTCRQDGSGTNVTNGTSYTQANGIKETGTNTNNNLFAFNEADSNSTAQLTLSGAGSVQTRNIISGVIQAS